MDDEPGGRGEGQSRRPPPRAAWGEEQSRGEEEKDREKERGRSKEKGQRAAAKRKRRMEAAGRSLRGEARKSSLGSIGGTAIDPDLRYRWKFAAKAAKEVKKKRRSSLSSGPSGSGDESIEPWSSVCARCGRWRQAP